MIIGLNIPQHHNYNTIQYKTALASFWRADLDPIYLCELLTACKVNDNGDAMITKLSVNPPSGPVDTKFTVSKFKILCIIHMIGNILQPVGLLGVLITLVPQ